MFEDTWWYLHTKYELLTYNIKMNTNNLNQFALFPHLHIFVDTFWKVYLVLFLHFCKIKKQVPRVFRLLTLWFHLRYGIINWQWLFRRKIRKKWFAIRMSHGWGQQDVLDVRTVTIDFPTTILKCTFIIK